MSASLIILCFSSKGFGTRFVLINININFLCVTNKNPPSFIKLKVDFQRSDTVTGTVAVIFFILGWVNNANNTPSKGRLSCIWVIFLSGYHFHLFDSMHAVGSYKQPNSDTFSVRHKQVHYRYEMGPIVCCLWSWDLPSHGWNTSVRVHPW